MAGPLTKPLVAALLLIVAWPQLAGAQALTPAGIVTTLKGQATVARAALPETGLPLKFRDPVFTRDTIRTAESSIVRLLMGGKALVTVREQSIFTVSEEADRSRIGLESGKLAVAVARQRMRAGEAVEVRTPNVIAGVRGTVVVFETFRATAQASAPLTAVTSNIYVLRGSVEVMPRLPTSASAGAQLAAAQGGPVVVGPLQGLTVTGSVFGPVRPIPPDQVAQILAGLGSGPQHVGVPENVKEQISTSNMGTATDLARILAGQLVIPPPTIPVPNIDILPCTGLQCQQPAPSAFESGFESGDFTGWTKTGAGAVITGLGSIAPPEGQYMAILHTGLGAVGARTSTLKSDPVASGAVYRLLASYNFLSNEYPGRSTTFDDRLTISVIDGVGATVFQRTESRNTSFTPSTVSPETATAGGFTILAGSGVTGWKQIDQTIVSTGNGLDGILFSITDVGDGIRDSAVLVDAVAILLDPPLYLLRDGSALSRPAGVPLLDVAGRADTFDSLLVVCCGSSATLGDALLRATDSTLTVPFSLMSAVQGGRVVSTSSDPLIQVARGTYALGRDMGTVDLAGTAVATDAATGLTLGTDRPLQHAGIVLDAAGAQVSTRSVVRIDSALLEASAPLLALREASTLTTGGPAVDLAYRAKVTALGSVVRLDASTLNVAGAVVNVNASVFSGSGTLLSLANGSTLNAGLLASVSGGGIFSWSGPLATFTGTGNVVNLSNSLCAGAGCVTAGGLRFALQDGALASNVTVTNATPFVGAGGSVNVAPTAAHVLVSGSTSKVTLAP